MLTQDAFRLWLKALPPQTVLGPNSSLFLDPLSRYVREETGEAYIVLPDTIALWDGYGFASLERTPLWARVVLWTLDHWEGDYTAQDALDVLTHLDEHTTRYASGSPFTLEMDPRQLQEEYHDNE